MRTAILSTAVALMLVTGSARAGSPKPLPADAGNGRVAWFDLTTTDLAKSKEFYAKLFEWKFEAVEGSDQAAEIVAGGTSIGTIRVADGKISPFNGVVYVQVSDIQAMCKRAKELGATVVPGFPFNLPQARGAIGLMLDPGGHPLGMYSRTSIPPAPPAPATPK